MANLAFAAAFAAVPAVYLTHGPQAAAATVAVALVAGLVSLITSE